MPPFIPPVLALVLVVFLTANAIFWGLFPHRLHCKLAAALRMPVCLPHNAHLTFGVACAAAAFLLAQWDHLYGPKGRAH
jgi:hypothetical protein